MILPVAGASAILWRDDDVTALDRFLDEGKHAGAPAPVYAAVHPDHRRVSAGAALHERLKEVRGDVHVADAAAVRDLLEIHHALTARAVDAVGARLLGHVTREVACRMVLPLATDVQRLGARSWASGVGRLGVRACGVEQQKEGGTSREEAAHGRSDGQIEARHVLISERVWRVREV